MTFPAIHTLDDAYTSIAIAINNSDLDHLDEIEYTTGQWLLSKETKSALAALIDAAQQVISKYAA